ncbi:hypothetical protein DL93DRAFT_2163148 [Clavulina sp. PMI_390]|nr:hypothetical protein DL93DRAFT_2163148 [Clavulina sp. PMI_390]
MSDICRAALQFQARMPNKEDVMENLDIQAWILEQLEVGNSKPDSWYNDYSKEIQMQEAEHGGIRRGLEAAGYEGFVVRPSTNKF